MQTHTYMCQDNFKWDRLTTMHNTHTHTHTHIQYHTHATQRKVGNIIPPTNTHTHTGSLSFFFSPDTNQSRQTDVPIQQSKKECVKDATGSTTIGEKLNIRSCNFTQSQRSVAPRVLSQALLGTITVQY